MYNLRDLKQRERFIIDADKDGDACPVDAICDSIPDVVTFIRELEEKVRGYRGQVQKLEADKRDLERKVNNIKSQKFRQIKKKGK
jgi:hypothetical protein